MAQTRKVSIPNDDVSQSPIAYAATAMFGSNAARYAFFNAIGDKFDYGITWLRLSSVGEELLKSQTNIADPLPDTTFLGPTPVAASMLGVAATFPVIAGVQAIYRASRAREKLTYGHLRRRLKEANPDTPDSELTNEKIAEEFNALLRRNKAAPAPVAGAEIDAFFADAGNPELHEKLEETDKLPVINARLRIMHQALLDQKTGADNREACEAFRVDLDRINARLKALKAAQKKLEEEFYNKFADQLNAHEDPAYLEAKKKLANSAHAIEIGRIRNFLQAENQRLRAENKRLIQDRVDDQAAHPFIRFFNKYSRVVNKVRTHYFGQGVKQAYDGPFFLSYAFWLSFVPVAIAVSFFALPAVAVPAALATVLSIAGGIGLFFLVPKVAQLVKDAFSKTTSVPDTSAQEADLVRQSTVLKTRLFLKHRHSYLEKQFGQPKVEIARHQVHQDDELFLSEVDFPLSEKEKKEKQKADDNKLITIGLPKQPDDLDDADDNYRALQSGDADEINAIYAGINANLPTFIDEKVALKQARAKTLTESKLGQRLLGSRFNRGARIGATLFLQAMTGFVSVAFILWLGSAFATALAVPALGFAAALFNSAAGFLGLGSVTAAVGGVVASIFSLKAVAKLRAEEVAYENKLHDVLFATYKRTNKDGDEITEISLKTGNPKTNLEKYTELEECLALQHADIEQRNKELLRNRVKLKYQLDARNKAHDQYLYDEQKYNKSVGTRVGQFFDTVFRWSYVGQTAVYTVRAFGLGGGMGGVLAGAGIFTFAAGLITGGAAIAFVAIAVAAFFVIGGIGVYLARQNQIRQENEAFLNSMGDRMDGMRKQIKENDDYIAYLQAAKPKTNRVDISQDASARPKRKTVVTSRNGGTYEKGSSDEEDARSSSDDENAALLNGSGDESNNSVPLKEEDEEDPSPLELRRRRNAREGLLHNNLHNNNVHNEKGRAVGAGGSALNGHPLDLATEGNFRIH